MFVFNKTQKHFSVA